jgi:hypothetical protein
MSIRGAFAVERTEPCEESLAGLAGDVRVRPCKTVRWYLENEDWVSEVTSSEFVPGRPTMRIMNFVAGQERPGWRELQRSLTTHRSGCSA